MTDISIAIVDDDRSLRHALVSLLQASDYLAVGFENAEAFLRSTEVDTVDCLVTDIHMPGMNGLELKRTMAARRSSLPVIMMTALQERSIISDALASGPICLLSKPFESERLLECLDRVFAER